MHNSSKSGKPTAAIVELDAVLCARRGCTAKTRCDSVEIAHDWRAIDYPSVDNLIWDSASGRRTVDPGACRLRGGCRGCWSRRVLRPNSRSTRLFDVLGRAGHPIINTTHFSSGSSERDSEEPGRSLFRQ